MYTKIRVLVRGLTKMNRGKEICIGGIDLSTKKHVRLNKNKTYPMNHLRILIFYLYMNLQVNTIHTMIRRKIFSTIKFQKK
jgi:hypothetical protein